MVANQPVAGEGLSLLKFPSHSPNVRGRASAAVGVHDPPYKGEVHMLREERCRRESDIVPNGRSASSMSKQGAAHHSTAPSNNGVWGSFVHPVSFVSWKKSPRMEDVAPGSKIPDHSRIRSIQSDHVSRVGMLGPRNMVGSPANGWCGSRTILPLRGDGTQVKRFPSSLGPFRTMSDHRWSDP